MFAKPQISLRERCHINTDEDGDNFVGVKASSENASICFPLGYQLPDNDDDLRIDIQNLFGVLATFMKTEGIIEDKNATSSDAVDFPIHAYLTIVRDFLENGRYYKETDPIYKTDTKGRISWARTFKEQRPLVQRNGTLVFTNMTVRSNSPNETNKLSQIHRFCVYEAFDKMGWLYVPFMPAPVQQHPSTSESIYLLTQKLASTNRDTEQELFYAMLCILKYVDRQGHATQYSFGTEAFDKVWERMIDKAFGITEKEQYFPRTRWILDYGPQKEKRPLYPDSIMIYDGKYYVLDAKYYRYGVTGNPDHLPNGTDINKQITYGEYIANVKGIPNNSLFNCFIMPFNSANNPFHISGPIDTIGEAIGDWRYNPASPHMQNYERIQGIVMDTRYLMYNFIGTPDQQKEELAQCIRRIQTRNDVPAPIDK